MKLGLFMPERVKSFDKMSASLWIRALQIVPHYQAMGISVCINHFFKQYDVAILYREYTFKTLIKLFYLKLIAKKVFYDQVVNVFIHHNNVSAMQVWVARIIAKNIDGCICSTNPTQQSAKLLTNYTTVIPDCISLSHFKYKKATINYTEPTFIWSGICKKAKALSPYSDVIDANIILITNQPIELSFNYEYIKWSHQTFPQDILRGDIAFLPRDTSTVYNQGHSEFKALVFANASMPIIANKLPSYQKLSKYYESIVFLEDYNNDVYQCVQALIKKSRDTAQIRQLYSSHSFAYQVHQFVCNENLGNNTE
jgi:hypothetical protein